MAPEDLNWFESSIENFQVEGRCVSIKASHVGTTEDPKTVKVVFNGVASIRREVTEYIGNPRENPTFKKPYVVEDLSPLALPNIKQFGLEGVSTFKPIAWLDIEIQAQGATVEVL